MTGSEPPGLTSGHFKSLLFALFAPLPIIFGMLMEHRAVTNLMTLAKKLCAQANGQHLVVNNCITS
jgi:hypothetical protein